MIMWNPTSKRWEDDTDPLFNLYEAQIGEDHTKTFSTKREFWDWFYEIHTSDDQKLSFYESRIKLVYSENSTLSSANHYAIKILEKVLYNFKNETYTLKWVETLIFDNDYYGPFILKCLGYLNIKSFELKSKLISRALESEDLFMRDAAINAIDNWEDVRFMPTLRKQLVKERIYWLKEYIFDIINDFDDEFHKKFGNSLSKILDFILTSMQSVTNGNFLFVCPSYNRARGTFYYFIDFFLKRQKIPFNATRQNQISLENGSYIQFIGLIDRQCFLGKDYDGIFIEDLNIDNDLYDIITSVLKTRNGWLLKGYNLQ